MECDDAGRSAIPSEPNSELLTSLLSFRTRFLGEESAFLPPASPRFLNGGIARSSPGRDFSLTPEVTLVPRVHR